MSEIHPTDIKNLSIVRESIFNFIREASTLDNENISVLDIAPRIYKGDRNFLLNQKYQ